MKTPLFEELFFSKYRYKLRKEFLKCDDVEKLKFHSSKSEISVNNVDIDKKTMSHKFGCGKELLNISSVTKMVKKL